MKRTIGLAFLISIVLFGCGGGGGGGGSNSGSSSVSSGGFSSSANASSSSSSISSSSSSISSSSSSMSSTGSSVSSSNSSSVSSGGGISILNDTGITSMGYDTAGNNLTTCTGAVAGSDCNTGRDVTVNNNSDGHAGFSFTKLDANGKTLAASATSWSCVKDNVTGLVWENKTATNSLLLYTNYDSTTVKQFWNGSAYVTPTQAQIDASSNAVGYKNAVNALGLCGASDWRLPTAEELHGLIDYSVVVTLSPMIDATWFPNTQHAAYWSSSTYSYSLAPWNGWVVDFNSGGITVGSRGITSAVRLVRGGQATVSNRFQVSSDGREVTDTVTNLIWRRCADGLTWSGSSCDGTGTKYSAVNALLRAKSEATSTGLAWRLPNVKELASLVDRNKYNPAIDTTAFPDMASVFNITYYWSSSPSPVYKQAYIVSFPSGLVEYHDISFSRMVRLVRSGP